MSAEACESCLARSWLLHRLAPNLERVRSRIGATLELGDEELVHAVAGKAAPTVLGELRGFDPTRAARQREQAGVQAICRHDPAYPPGLLDLAAPPATLFRAGEREVLERVGSGQAVAVVGTRTPTPYGSEISRSLAEQLARCGVAVISGMALGIDSAAHAGALREPGGTIAVLPAGADRAYPAGKRGLLRRIQSAGGCAISELPPGSRVWRWTFLARNRIVAALTPATVVVEAGERSGALITAELAQALGRRVGAVPGRITTPAAAGPHALLADGADLITGAQDVLDIVFGVGERRLARDSMPELSEPERGLLDQLRSGTEGAEAFAGAGLTAEQGLAALASLELAGQLRREAGGRFTVSS